VVTDCLEYLRSRGIAVETGAGSPAVPMSGSLTPGAFVALHEYGSELTDYLRMRGQDAVETPPVSHVSGHNRLALSFAQQRVWYLHRFISNKPAVNIGFSVELNGPLNTRVLQGALRQLMQRHEILRSAFDLDTPTAIVRADAELNLAHSSVENEDEASRRETAQQCVLGEMRREFVLDQCPLMRVGLIRLGPELHIFWLVAHQLIFDNFSTNVFLAELARAYAAAGFDARDLPIQYAGYADWQNGRIESGVTSEAVSFWRDFLPHPLPTLDLHGDYKRPAVKSYLGKSLRARVPQIITDSVRRVAREADCSPETLLFAAFGLLLYRHTNHEVILPGLITHNRTFSGARDLIGRFENVLPIPFSFRGDAPFIELLGETRQQCLNAAIHHETPFEYLLTQLDIDRDLSRSPVCQAMFGFTAQWNARLPRLGEATITPLSLPSVGCKADLVLRVQDSAEQLELVLEYSSDIYDGTTAAYLLDRYEVLLNSISMAPFRPIAELPLLPEREIKQLRDWNNTATALEAVCPIHLIEQQVARSPHATALIFDDDSYTYEQLDKRANQLARQLETEAMSAGQLVGIYMHRCPDMIAALLAVWKVGAAYIPLDPFYPRERISYVIQDSGMRAVITSRSLRDELPTNLVRCLCVDANPESGEDQQGEHRPPAKSTLDDLAYVIYTSGSTGKPKGVEVTNLGVTNLLQAMRREPGIGSCDTIVALTTLSFDIAVAEIFLPLIAGARIVLCSRATAADPFALLKVFDHTQPSMVQATPATWRMLLDAGWKGKHQVKILVGGEALSSDLAQLLIERASSVWNMYGPTETTVWATLWKVELGHRIVIGKPMANTTALIVDGGLRPVPLGMPGELCLGGVQVARGYHARPELNAERFVPDPFFESGGRTYRTGDLARFLADGNIEFLGRLDHQVKIRGFRIELGEIESVLRQHASVDKAVVIARDDSGEKRLAAYVTLQAGSALAPEKLRAHLRCQLPEYMIPPHFVALQEFPLTPNGKIDRLMLPSPEKVRAEAALPQRTYCDSVERLLVGIWESTLGVKTVGPCDNFFELGGDSLLAVRVMVNIEKVFGKKLPIITFFEAPTIEQLADKIRSDSRPEFSCIVSIQTEGDCTPIFLMHGLGGNVLGYRPLVSHLGRLRPIYGIQAIGVDGKQTPLDDVTQMARRYVDEIRRVQPHGPYYLGGLSLGGVIVLEMASLLEAQGETTGALILMDAYAYGVEKLVGTRRRLATRMAIRRLALHARNISGLSYADAVTYLRKRTRSLARRTIWRLRSNRYKNFLPGVDELPRSYNAVAHAAWTAVKRYVPKPYEGNVLLLRAKDEPFLRHDDATLGWGSLVRNGLTVCEVAGDHLNFVTEPHVQDTARQILAYMNSIEQHALATVVPRDASTTESGVLTGTGGICVSPVTGADASPAIH